MNQTAENMQVERIKSEGNTQDYNTSRQAVNMKERLSCMEDVMS